MPSDTDWGRAADKLIRMTQSEKLRWRADEQVKASRDDVEGNAYTCSVDNRYVTVFEYRYKEYADTGGSSGVVEYGEYEWEKEVAIEFVDHEGTLEWRWPQTAYAWSLLDAVRCQVARGPEFIKSFLADVDP